MPDSPSISLYADHPLLPGYVYTYPQFYQRNEHRFAHTHEPISNLMTYIGFRTLSDLHNLYSSMKAAEASSYISTLMSDHSYEKDGQQHIRFKISGVELEIPCSALCVDPQCTITRMGNKIPIVWIDKNVAAQLAQICGKELDPIEKWEPKRIRRVRRVLKFSAGIDAPLEDDYAKLTGNELQNLVRKPLQSRASKFDADAQSKPDELPPQRLMHILRLARHEHAAHFNTRFRELITMALARDALAEKDIEETATITHHGIPYPLCDFKIAKGDVWVKGDTIENLLHGLSVHEPEQVLKRLVIGTAVSGGLPSLGKRGH